jgi:SpoVK/Ycf46/Vps4 family AAA+-type ATPase
VTRSERTNLDIQDLLRSRHSLLWVVTREETRVERALIEAAAAASYDVHLWDCVAGEQDAAGQVLDAGRADLGAMLQGIRDTENRTVYILRDAHAPEHLHVFNRRALRSLARHLEAAPRNQARAVIVLSPSGDIPLELQTCTTVIDYPLPERSEINRALDDVIAALPPDIGQAVATNGTREKAVDAALGLTIQEASNCYARSLVTTNREHARPDIDPAIVSAEKKRVISRERVLSWYDPDPRGLDAIGGLDLLKDWLRQRRSALTAKARAFGLPAPKGILLVGPPGTGKSLTAKAVSTAWGIPLLRLDMGALKSKFVGESEGNIRKALAVAETVSPCVLWVDEIEKALQGGTGSNDGGVSADALGTLLSWMQERQGQVFVVATANDVSVLPPELLRKGRFDELFFVDLPTAQERAAILKAALAQHGREFAPDWLQAIASQTPGFTGAELAAIVPDALFTAYAAERELDPADLMNAASTVCPLSRTAAEKIAALRDWAKTRARPANAPNIGPEPARPNAGRVLDV